MMNQRTSRDIHAEIEETRTETSRTIDEIQARLSPSQIIDQVLWHLRSGGGRAVADGAGEFTSNLVRTIRENPVPSLLIGTGLAWFAIASMRGPDHPAHEDDAKLYDDELGFGRAPEAAARYGRRTGHVEERPARDPHPAAPATPPASRPATAPAPPPDPRPTPTAEAVRAADPHAPFGRQNLGATPASRPDHMSQQAREDAEGAAERARRSAEAARERAERATSTAREAPAASTPGSDLHGMSTVEAVRAADPHAPFSPRSVDAKRRKQ